MLDLKNVSKTFNPGSPDAKRALDGLSLHLDRGDFVTIVGSNGAGKSTLFNAIGGSFFVDTGSISLGGRDITFMPEHNRSRVIGRLFQDPLRGTAPHMTIEENLALAYLRSSHGNPFKRTSHKDRQYSLRRRKLLLCIRNALIAEVTCHSNIFAILRHLQHTPSRTVYADQFCIFISH